MLARSKLSSIESKISEALINNEINHENFVTVINVERNYQELKETIWMMNSKRKGTKKVNLIEEGKKEKGTDEIIKRNKIINKNLKSQI